MTKIFARFVIFALLIVLNAVGCGIRGGDDDSGRRVQVNVQYPEEMEGLAGGLIAEGTLYKSSEFSVGNKVSGPVKGFSSDGTDLEFTFLDDVEDGNYYLSIFFKDGFAALEAEGTEPIYQESNAPILASLKASITFKKGKDAHISFSAASFDLSYDDENGKAESCDNGADDNGDKLIDCEDPTCESDQLCVEKKDQPDVDLFVMSHCPFATQMEKGLLPVWDIFGDKINLNIRFCDYSMHGKKEIDEELRQYCIQKAGTKIYRKYLGCFLKEGKEDNTCVKEASVNELELSACVQSTDKEFSITNNFDDEAKWNGPFPPFGIDAEMGKKFGVRASPTLIINGVVVESGRSPKDLLDVVCKAFKEEPAECEKQLDAATPLPGFGFGDGTE